MTVLEEMQRELAELKKKVDALEAREHSHDHLYADLYSSADLRLAGGLYVGGTTVDPATGDIINTGDIRAGGGLYVGGTGTDPATGEIQLTSNLKVGGQILSSTVIGCAAYHNIAQAIGSGSLAYLSFNSEWWDTDSIHDVSTNNGRLTCQHAGKYLVIAKIRFNFNGYAGTRQVGIFSGASHAQIAAQHVHAASTTVACNIECSCINDMAVNDYVECGVYQDSGYSCDVTYSAYWSPVFQMVRMA